MDIKVSRKETRLQPDGAEEVLRSNIFDVYPIYGSFDTNLITDVEILDGDPEELLDRAMFAIVKQRGLDPVDLESGVQWAEAVIGEVPPEAILQQVQFEVQSEGPRVRAGYDISIDEKGTERLVVSVLVI